MPETSQDIVDDELARLSLVKVKCKLTSMVVLVNVDNLLDTSLSCRIPSGTRQYLDGIVLYHGNLQRLRKLQLAGNNRSIRIHADTLTGTDAYLNVFLIVANGRFLQNRFSIDNSCIPDFDTAQSGVTVFVDTEQPLDVYPQALQETNLFLCIVGLVSPEPPLICFGIFRKVFGIVSLLGVTSLLGIVGFLGSLGQCRPVSIDGIATYTAATS